MTDVSKALPIGPDYGGWCGPLKLEAIIGLLAGPDARLVYSDDGNGADLVTVHGHITAPDINRMLNNGWLESGNGCYRLTDGGRLAFLRSTDELQDCGLVAPLSEILATSQKDSKP